MEPKGHPRPCKVAQRPKKHIQTARGRVLAEGDLDPAAGSRDEPTKLPVEDPVAERKQGIEVQVTRALFLKSINWVPPLTPTFAGSTFWGLGVTPKHVKKSLKKQRAPMEAQRLKTRGRNPNPTAQAQSKCCFPLSTKTQNIIEHVAVPASIFCVFLFFPQK